jgi:hypothetical protein
MMKIQENRTQSPLFDAVVQHLGHRDIFHLFPHSEIETLRLKAASIVHKQYST